MNFEPYQLMEYYFVMPMLQPYDFQLFWYQKEESQPET
jgi:hypothetical protein